MTTTQVFKIGDKVKYSVRFLRSIGAYTGDLPFARGIVLEVKNQAYSPALVTVQWNNDAPCKVLASNLALISDPETRYI